jgi:pimeloyl-ACP methyl ester carboxylesterase
MRAIHEFRVDIGDIELAVTEWPGAGDPILLLHATGFHSRCWDQVVALLPDRHFYAVDLRFHGASGRKGKPDWGIMATDIGLLVETLDLQRAVGVGHSIGGYLVARAAAAAPQRFKKLILIDPVIMAAERYEDFHALATTLNAKDHPVSRRKNQWQDAQEMYERFKSRSPFSTWQPQVLRDYCDYALCPANDHEMQQLCCDPVNDGRHIP